MTSNDVTNFSFLANKHHWQCQKHIACQMQCFIFQTITFPFFRHIVFLLYYYLHRWMKSKRLIETIFMNKMWPLFSNVSTICFFSSFPRCRLEFDLSSYWKVFLLKCVVCPVSFAVIWFMKKDSRNISTLFFIQNKWNFKFDLKWTQFSLLWSELNFFPLHLLAKQQLVSKFYRHTFLSVQHTTLNPLEPHISWVFWIYNSHQAH